MTDRELLSEHARIMNTYGKDSEEVKIFTAQHKDNKDLSELMETAYKIKTALTTVNPDFTNLMNYHYKDASCYLSAAMDARKKDGKWGINNGVKLEAASDGLRSMMILKDFGVAGLRSLAKALTEAADKLEYLQEK